MAKQPGFLWSVIREWLDADWNPPSQNKLAARVGVSPSALSDYKYATHMPPPEFLENLAEQIRVPYERVLDAVLKDHGYRRPTPGDLKAREASATRAAEDRGRRAGSGLAKVKDVRLDEDPAVHESDPDHKAGSA